MVKRAIAALLLGAALSGCGALGQTALPSTGRLSGHVTVRACGGAAPRSGENACQSHPAAGVTVAFRQASTGRVLSATTDSTGGYSLTLTPGNYAATVQPGGTLGTGRNLGTSRQVTVVAGKTVTADFGYTVQLL